MSDSCRTLRRQRHGRPRVVARPGRTAGRTPTWCEIAWGVRLKGSAGDSQPSHPPARGGSPARDGRGRQERRRRSRGLSRARRAEGGAGFTVTQTIVCASGRLPRTARPQQLQTERYAGSVPVIRSSYGARVRSASTSDSLTLSTDLGGARGRPARLRFGRCDGGVVRRAASRPDRAGETGLRGSRATRGIRELQRLDVASPTAGPSSSAIAMARLRATTGRHPT